MASNEDTDDEFLLIHLDPRDFQADLKVYVEIQEQFKGEKLKDLTRLRDLALFIPKLQVEKQQKSAEVFQAKELLNRFKNSYSYGSKTSENDGERKKLGDLDEKHFLLKQERNSIIDQIVELQNEFKTLFEKIYKNYPRLNSAEAFFDFYGREVDNFSIFTLAEPYESDTYIFLPVSISLEIRDKLRNFIPIREDSAIGKSVYRKEKGTVIEVELHDNRKITTLITNTRAPNLEEMKVIAELFHSATTIIGNKARSIKVHDRWATGSYDRFQDGARDDMNAICGTCKALLFSTSHLKGCKFYINP
jgi:hypothetical protein